jgi:hypothetical protein
MTPAHSRRIRLVSEAVVASYIHDISAHTDSGATPAPVRRHGIRADQLAHTRQALRRREDLAHARRDHQVASRANATTRARTLPASAARVSRVGRASARAG